jgi:hypothetical protein
MKRPGYRDDSSEQAFNETEQRLYRWADAWRLLYHRYEALLFDDAMIRRGLLEGLATREEPTQYLCDGSESVSEALSQPDTQRTRRGR